MAKIKLKSSKELMVNAARDANECGKRTPSMSEYYQGKIDGLKIALFFLSSSDKFDSQLVAWSDELGGVSRGQ